MHNLIMVCVIDGDTKHMTIVMRCESGWPRRQPKGLQSQTFGETARQSKLSGPQLIAHCR